MNHPENISFIVQWPIQSSTPEDLSTFLKEVRKTNKEMVKDTGVFDPFRLYFLYGRMRLSWKSGITRLHVDYDHYIETDSGEWKEEHRTFEIDGNGNNLTIGDLLFHIQMNTSEILGGEEAFNFPEALEISDEITRDGVPVYDLLLGS